MSLKIRTVKSLTAVITYRSDASQATMVTFNFLPSSGSGQLVIDNIN